MGHISCREEQVFMDCAPLCPITREVASPCPSVCVGGCGCLEGMVIDEVEQRRCVIQCPNQGMSIYTGILLLNHLCV